MLTYVVDHDGYWAALYEGDVLVFDGHPGDVQRELMERTTQQQVDHSGYWELDGPYISLEEELDRTRPTAD